MIDFKNNVLVLLCLLYYLQGIPYGVQIKSLPIYLFDILKFPVETVTKTNLLMCPWIFLKPLVISIIDIKYHSLKIFYASLAANVILNLCLFLLFSSTVDIVFNYYYVLFLLFLINCFTVLLDVATDQLIIISATSVNDIKFFGLSNAIQIVTYKLGASFSGIVLQIIDYENVSFVFLLVSGVYCVAMMLVATVFKKFICSLPVQHSSEVLNLNISGIFRAVFFSKCNVLFLIFILTYKLGEIGAMSILPLYMVESGVSRRTFTFFTSVICEPLSLIGSLAGGMIWSLYKGGPSSLVNILTVVGFSRIIPLILLHFSFTSALSLSFFELTNVLSMAFLWFLSGAVSAFAFTLMTMVSCLSGKNTYAASCYAVMSSFEVFGKVFFSAQAGSLGNYFGKDNVFALFSFCCFASSTLLLGFKHFLQNEIENNTNKSD